MEPQEKVKVIKKKRSDWCKALSYLSKEQKICQNCIALKEQLKDYVLPLESAIKKLDGINLQDFEATMRKVGKPTIFSNEHIQFPHSFLIYYQQEVDFDELYASLPINSEGAIPAATIVSPDYYSKSKRSQETSLVKEIQKYFNPTAFIKLQLYDIDELINYAGSERCEMMLLPMTKLADYLTIVLANPKMEIIPAAFYPIKN